MWQTLYLSYSYYICAWCQGFLFRDKPFIHYIHCASFFNYSPLYKLLLIAEYKEVDNHKQSIIAAKLLGSNNTIS